MVLLCSVTNRANSCSVCSDTIIVVDLIFSLDAYSSEKLQKNGRIFPIIFVPRTIS